MPKSKDVPIAVGELVAQLQHTRQAQGQDIGSDASQVTSEPSSSWHGLTRVAAT
jgi:hypothetical protein